MSAKTTTTGLFCLQPNPEAQIRLFCFHHAGGSAAVFRPWFGSLPDHIELWTVQLSGRGERSHEPPLKRLRQIAERISDALIPYLEKPFVFFGHSMGAAIAFEIARMVRQRCGVQPVHLIVSGCQAPQRMDFGPHSYELPDAEFIEKLRGLNGTPASLLENPRMLEVVLPIIRADVEALQTYKYVPDLPLDCSLTVLGGSQDKVVNLINLMAWRKQSTSRSIAYMLPGDHFFLNSAQPLILQIIATELSRFAATVHQPVTE